MDDWGLIILMYRTKIKRVEFKYAISGNSVGYKFWHNVFKISLAINYFIRVSRSTSIFQNGWRIPVKSLGTLSVDSGFLLCFRMLFHSQIQPPINQYNQYMKYTSSPWEDILPTALDPLVVLLDLKYLYTNRVCAYIQLKTQCMFELLLLTGLILGFMMTS